VVQHFEISGKDRRVKGAERKVGEYQETLAYVATGSTTCRAIGGEPTLGNEKKKVNFKVERYLFKVKGSGDKIDDGPPVGLRGTV